MPDPTEPTIKIEDVAAPYADMTPEKHRAAFGRDYSGPDWRFSIVWSDGGEACMWAGATATDVELAIRLRAERQAAGHV